jgi:hypothetical protein
MQRVIVVAREIILLNRAALQPLEVLCVVAGFGFCFSVEFALLVAFLNGFTFSASFVGFFNCEFHGIQ